MRISVPSAAPAVPRCSTGIPGLDDILGGGYPAGHLYLVEGDAGAGKTTMALQFLMAGAQAGEAGLYITLSETERELRAVAHSHGFDLSGITIVDLQTTDLSLKSEGEYTLFHPSEVELSETTRSIIDTVDRLRPKRICFDSLSEMRLLARDSLRYRRQILALKHYLAARNVSVLLLDISSPREGEYPIESVAHGVIRLAQVAPEYGGQRRRLRVQKMRGVKYRDGYHDFLIKSGGVEVYPRLVAADHHPSKLGPTGSTGIPELDEMLGGGFEPGTSTMLLGPSGVGKTTLATQFLCAAANRGDHIAVYSFDESKATWLQRSEALGLGLQKHLDEGRVLYRQIDPASVSPGEFAADVRKRVHAGCKVVVIDSLNGYLAAMPSEQHLALHMHELLAYLGQQGVTTVAVLAQHGIVGEGVVAPLDLSYIADNVVLMRYFEAFGEVRQAISVLKKRIGKHQRTIRELKFNGSGLRVGRELRELQGVLGGDLKYYGEQAPLMDRRAHDA